jgi:acyl-CoA thioester hydrolase
MQPKRIELRWRDLDTYGHVNNAVYLFLLEEVRGAWLAGTLDDPAAIERFVVARVAIDYRRPITRAEGALLGTCAVERMGRSSLTTHEVLRTTDGTLVAEAEVVLVAHSGATEQSRPLRADERAAFETTSGGTKS